MRARTLVLTFILALVCATNALAQKGQFAVPEGADVVKYPINQYPTNIGDRITALQMAKLGQTAKLSLHVRSLEKETVVENHFRNLHGKEGRFVLETLPIGTIVLTDEKGVLLYKWDCGNRIVERKPAVAKAEVPPGSALPAPVASPQLNVERGPANTSALSGWRYGWMWLGEMLNTFGHWIVDWIVIIAKALLALLVIGLLIAGLTEIWNWFRRHLGYDNQVPANPPAPAPIQQAVQASVPPAATVQPVADLPAEVPPATNDTRAQLFYAAGSGTQPHMVRTRGGVTLHSVEHDADGTHTVRYRTGQ